MTKNEIEEILLASGWSKDRMGRLTKDRALRRPGQESPYTRKFQVTLGPISCRIDTRIPGDSTGPSPVKSKWLRIGGAYYKDVNLLSDGRVRIGGYFLGTNHGDI